MVSCSLFALFHLTTLSLVCCSVGVARFALVYLINDDFSREDLISLERCNSMLFLLVDEAICRFLPSMLEERDFGKIVLRRSYTTSGGSEYASDRLWDHEFVVTSKTSTIAYWNEGYSVDQDIIKFTSFVIPGLDGKSIPLFLISCPPVPSLYNYAIDKIEVDCSLMKWDSYLLITTSRIVPGPRELTLVTVIANRIFVYRNGFEGTTLKTLNGLITILEIPSQNVYRGSPNLSLKLQPKSLSHGNLLQTSQGFFDHDPNDGPRFREYFLRGKIASLKKEDERVTADVGVIKIELEPTSLIILDNESIPSYLLPTAIQCAKKRTLPNHFRLSILKDRKVKIEARGELPFDIVLINYGIPFCIISPSLDETFGPEGFDSLLIVSPNISNGIFSLMAEEHDDDDDESNADSLFERLAEFQFPDDPAFCLYLKVD